MRNNILPTRFIYSFILLLFISSACVNKKVVLATRIKDNAGESNKELKINLQNKDKFVPTYDFKRTATTKNGLLKLKVKPNQSYILEIEGEQGVGRVLLSPEKYSDTINITYPVQEKIVFLHNNDLHFDLNNLEEFTRKVVEFQDSYDDVFLLSAGDIFVRHAHRWIDNNTLKDTAWYNDRAMKMINEMNELGYDLMTLGNHELDYVGNYTRMALEEAHFPLLAANIEIFTDKLFSFDPFSNFETSTLRNVSVLGLSRDNGKKEGVVELNFIETINKYIYLKDNSDVFLVLSHRGLNEDKSIAETFPQIDAIIGGHSHNLLEKGELINSVLIAQAGGNPHIVSDDHPVYLGILIFTLINGEITNKESQVIRIGE